MSRTTPPRPIDVTAVFPQLAPLARTATRLHPRTGSPSPYASSVGGPLLWPAAEPWPTCNGPHEWDHVNPALSPEDVHLQRRMKVAAARRSMGRPRYTPEEISIDERINAGCPWPEGPIAMLPVSQLYARDVPLPHPPPQADLLQVLWCPFDHGMKPYPRTLLFWRTAATVTDVLTTLPQPPAAQFPGYVPEPCLLNPERITEYPNSMELSKELREPLGDTSVWRAAGAVLDSAYASYPEALYRHALSEAPGWKVGGWTSWGLTDPVPRICPTCGTEMDPLLTIASREWNNTTRSWIPQEDQIRGTESIPERYRANPPMIELPGLSHLQLYVCPASPDHPLLDLIQ